MVTVETAEPEQPFEVPVTVYDVVAVGETVIEAVVSPPDHEYESAPVAVSVAEPPEQIVSELTATVNDGPIVTVATADPEQPFEVPVTV
jgi:hypothetical protein